MATETDGTTTTLDASDDSLLDLNLNDGTLNDGTLNDGTLNDSDSQTSQPRSEVRRPKRKAKEHQPVVSSTDLTAKEVLQRCEMLSRVNHLMWFNDTNRAEVIRIALGDDPSVQNLVGTAKKKFNTNNSNWKTCTIKRFKAHVENICKRDIMVNGSKDADILTQWFFSNCNLTTIMELFYFTKGVVNISESTPLAQAYVRNMYAFLAGFVKLHLDWEKSNGPVNDKYNEGNLHSFYQNMACDSAWDALSTDDFSLHNIAAKKQKTAAAEVVTPTTVGFKIRDPDGVLGAGRSL